MTAKFRSETMVLLILSYDACWEIINTQVSKYTSNYSLVIRYLPIANSSSSRCFDNRNHSLKEVVRIFKCIFHKTWLSKVLKFKDYFSWNVEYYDVFNCSIDFLPCQMRRYQSHHREKCALSEDSIFPLFQASFVQMRC